MSSETVDVSIEPEGHTAWFERLSHFLQPYGSVAKKLLLFGQLYVAISALAMSATVIIALSLPLNPAPLVMGLVMFSVYLGDRVGDVKDDESATADRQEFFQKHRTKLSVLSAGAYGLAIGIGVYGGPVSLLLTLIPGIFWILYATEFLPTISSALKRVKSVLVVNSAFVSLAWSIPLVFLPLSFTKQSLSPAVVVVFVYFILDFFINTEIPNVRDIDEDKANGVSTIPVVFGVKRTRQILYALDIFLLTFLAIAFVNGILPVAFAGATIVGTVYAIMITGFVGRTDNYGKLTLLGESKQFFIGAFLIFVSVFPL
jgi:4-hydroxybenzoate polyprenyltransferase